MDERVKIYFDGGCRPNPGEMETAVVVRGAATLNRAAGSGDSEVAEWLALIAALSAARDQGISSPLLLGDSAGVVAQANGEAIGRSEQLRLLHARFAEECGHFARVQVRLIKRTQNLAGIALAQARQRRWPATDGASR